MYDWLSTVNDKFCLILNYSKVVWDIDTKFSPVVVLMSFELPKGMAVFLSELCPSNLVESWKLMSTTTGENLVSISQTTFE